MAARRRIVRPRLVEKEILAIALRIAEDDLDAGYRFLDAVEETIEKLAEMPYLGGTLEIDDPKVARVRVWPVRGFENHLILYRPRRDGVSILHVVHGARDMSSFLGLN